jgi:pimeloyl-ACP methyl ester carboxylesterase
MIDLAEKGAYDNVTTLLWQRLVAPARLTDEPLRLLVRRMADDIGADGFVRQQKAIMKRPDSRPVLTGLSLPTLVLVGEEDEITPVAEAQEMAGLAGAKARLATLPGCGHLSTLEEPERVAAELARWLA